MHRLRNSARLRDLYEAREVSRRHFVSFSYHDTVRTWRRYTKLRRAAGCSLSRAVSIWRHTKRKRGCRHWNRVVRWIALVRRGLQILNTVQIRVGRQWGYNQWRAVRDLEMREAKRKRVTTSLTVSALPCGHPADMPYVSSVRANDRSEGR